MDNSFTSDLSSHDDKGVLGSLSSHDDNSSVLYTYRYMWKLKGIDKVFFKVVTDTHLGLIQFERNFIDTVSDCESFGYEYLGEFQISRLGEFVNIFNNKES